MDRQKRKALKPGRKGTDPRVISKVKNPYLAILNKPEIVDFYNSLMIEIAPLD